MLAETGRGLTGVFGGPLLYNTPDVLNRNGLVASNGAAHAEVIARLGPLLEEWGRVPA